MKKVYTVAGLSYFGEKNEKNIITGMAVNSGTLNTEDFADYVKAEHLEELVVIELGGQNDVISRDLSKREQLDYAAVRAEFSAAKEMAEAHLIGMVFDNFRRKK